MVKMIISYCLYIMFGFLLYYLDNNYSILILYVVTTYYFLKMQHLLNENIKSMRITQNAVLKIMNKEK